MNRSPTFTTLAIWLVALLVTVLMLLSTLPVSYTPDGYVPFGNDGFYHARRILDTVASPDAFYEFDPRIHAPAGSQLTWPWGYDYAMAQLVRLGMALGVADDPRTVLAYLPVLAVVMAMLLWLSTVRSLRISPLPASIVFFAVAFSPHTTNLFGVGSVDHHWAESVLVLGFLAAGLAWAAKPANRVRAVLLGCLLGMAPAVHNGLFILQVPLIACLALLWFRGQSVPKPAAVALAMALLGSTLLVLIPSEPFRQGRFEYYLLSWFHLYLAFVSAASILALAFTQPIRRHVFWLVLGVMILGVPLARHSLELGLFVGTSDPALQSIIEARSLFELADLLGTGAVIASYSGLVLLLPAVWVGTLWLLWRDRTLPITFLAVYGVLFMPLLLVQYRFHYYAMPALLLPLAVLLHRGLKATASPWLRLPVVLGAVLAFQPGARQLTGTQYSPGGELYYQISATGMDALGAACEGNPAVVLARPNDGHYIRFHTDCSVIANNFLLTQQHFEAFHRANALFQLTPAELLQAAPEVDLVFVRVRSALVQTSRGAEFVEREGAMMASSPLEDALLWSDPAALPPEFEMLGEIPGPLDYPLVRVYRINRAAIPAPAS